MPPAQSKLRVSTKDMQIAVAVGFISLDGLVPGAKVSVYRNEIIDAVQITVALTGKDRHQSCEVLRRLKPELFDQSKLILLKLAGKGNKPTKGLHFKDSIGLIMVFPGNISKRFRKHFSDILSRYLDGDLELCKEIQANNIMGKARSYSKFGRDCRRDTLQKVKEEEEAMRSTTMLMTFFIYATKTAAFPGLIKIGKTENMNTRLIGLNTGCAPVPHVIVVQSTSRNCRPDQVSPPFCSMISANRQVNVL